MKSPVNHSFYFFFVLTCFLFSKVNSQMVTGVWKGKINHQKAELRIIQRGDSLVGTSCYFETANNYRRYSIRGYFDQATNSTIWWDDQLLDERSGRFSIGSPGKIPLLSHSDFNCPGGGKMILSGKTYDKNEEDKIKGSVYLEKTNRPVFEDEWDYIIENYTAGTNDPDIIDSVARIANRPKPVPEKTVAVVPELKPVPQKDQKPKTTDDIAKPIAVVEKPVITSTVSAKPLTIEEKFVSRKKVLIKEIPLSGDSIELRFYDNGEIDGDSISLFLNDQLIFSHLLLTGQAHIIKLAKVELKETNELTMVAENLGRIPPNTSYMEARVGGLTYSTYLASSEGSSAMIRLIKPTQ